MPEVHLVVGVALLVEGYIIALRHRYPPEVDRWLGLRAMLRGFADAALPLVRDQLRRIPGRGLGYGLLRYLDLFVHLQTRTGRAQELYAKWVGGTMPDLTVKGVYY